MNIHFEENRSFNKKHLIIFIHGLNGSKKSFYDDKDKNYFHDHFSAKIRKNVDVAFLEYNTNILKGGLSIIYNKYLKIPFLNLISKTKLYLPIHNLAIEELANAAEHEIESIHEHYESISYICHSMGGLIIKGALINSKILQRKTEFYITLATPHRGTNKAIYINGLNRQVKGLKEGSDIIQHLTHHYETIKVFFSSHYYRATQEYWVLPKENAFPIYGTRKNTPVDCAHEEINSPRKNFYFQHFIDDINKRIEDNLYLSTSMKEDEKSSESEYINNKLCSIESKIDLLLNIAPDNSKTPAVSIKKEKGGSEYMLFDLEAGYSIIDIVQYDVDRYYLLLDNYDKSESVLIRVVNTIDIDLNFGLNGKMIVNFDSDNCQLSKILLSDEDVFLIGQSVQENNFKISICKSNLNGQINLDYGEKGYILRSSKNEHQYANDAIILDNKNIVTVGASFDSKSMLITCIDKDGDFVKSFGIEGNGTIESKFTEDHSWANKICRYDNNSFVVAGRTGSWEIFISLYTNEGKIDNRFKSDGTVFHKHFLRIEDLKVQSSGRILVVGVGNEGRVIGLTKNGVLDTSFGINGIIEIITNERSEALTLELYEDDSFVVGGMEYDGNSYNNGIVSFFTNDGKVENIVDNGFLSFTIKNKTKVNKLLLNSKNSLSALCTYNIDYSQNKRAKIGVSNIRLESEN